MNRFTPLATMTTGNPPPPNGAYTTRRAQSAGASNTLMSAMKKGHFHLIRDLVEQGCNVNERDGDMRTPLILCSVFEDEKWALSVARLLIEAGGKIHLSDKTGKNALMNACINEREALVQEFLNSMDFNLNAQDKFGCTALMHCAIGGNLRITSLVLNRLLRFDLPILKTNKKNQTATKCALDLGYLECAELIAREAKNQSDRWAVKQIERERRNTEAREIRLKEAKARRMAQNAALLASQQSDPANNEETKPLEPITEPTETESSLLEHNKATQEGAASYVDAVCLPVINQKLPHAEDAQPSNRESLVSPYFDSNIENLNENQIHELLFFGNNRPKTAGAPRGSRRALSRLSTPRGASSPKVPLAPNATTTVLKQAKERELIAKRQDFRRALSALPNRKRVLESKISTQSRRAGGDVLTSRPPTCISRSIVLNDEQSMHKTVVERLFEKYREQLTGSFRKSVATLKDAAEQQRRAETGEGGDEVDGAGSGGGAGGKHAKDNHHSGRDSAELSKKSKHPKKKSTGSAKKK